MKRIVFMGTADFGIPTLRTLAGAHDVAAVVTRCDSCRGRGRKLMPSPVKQAALDLGLDVIEADDLRDPAFAATLKGIGADLFFVVAFRILPPAVFTIPPDGTVNLHASLLPDYRGAAPIQWAIINGDAMTGLTTFYIEETVDTGDIILNTPVEIGPDETFGELSERMSDTGAGLAVRTVSMIERDVAHGIRQPTLGQRPAPRLFRRNGLIDWSRDARAIHDQVRGMNPRPGAYTERVDGPLKIHRTRVVDESSPGEPGIVTAASPKEGIEVSCGRGRLAILELQPPGRKAMDSASFVRGHGIAAGSPIHGG